MQNCGACGKTALIDLGYHPDGTIFRCTHCGTLRLLVSVKGQSDDSSSYGQSYRSGLDQGKSARLVELFTNAVGKAPIKHGRLVDVGCGDGSFIHIMACKGWTVAGIDSDEGTVKGLLSNGNDAHLGTLGSTQMPRFEGVDVITLWDLIEHVNDLDNAMRWLSDSLRTGGYLLVLTPNACSMLDRMARLERSVSFKRSQKLMRLCLNRYHVHRFTPEGIKILLERSGFLVTCLQPVQLYSLRPERYLSGFAPGIGGWTRNSGVDGYLSRVAFAALTRSGIKNKMFLVAQRTGNVPATPETAVRMNQ